MNPIEIFSKPLNLNPKLFQPVGNTPNVSLPSVSVKSPFSVITTPLSPKIAEVAQRYTASQTPTPFISKNPISIVSNPLPDKVTQLIKGSIETQNKVRPQDFRDVGNIPFELVVKPVLNAALSLNEVRTGKPSAKINVPFPHMKTVTEGDYTHQVPIEEPAVGTRRFYEDLIAKGVPEDQAWKASIVKTVGDMSVLVPVFRDATKLALLKSAPEKLINAEIINETTANVTKNQMRDYLSGRTSNFDMPQALRETIGEVLKTGTNEEKKSLLNGIIGTQTLSVEPSRLGKIVGLSQDQANTLLDQLYGGATRQAPVGALPGYREIPGQPAPIGLSTRKIEPVGFGKEIPPELQLLAQEAKKYKSAEEFVKAQEPLFHGTTKERPTLSKNVVSLDKNEWRAKNYAEAGGTQQFDLVEGKPRFSEMTTVIDEAGQKVSIAKNPIVDTFFLPNRGKVLKLGRWENGNLIPENLDVFKQTLDDLIAETEDKGLTRRSLKGMRDSIERYGFDWIFTKNDSVTDGIFNTKIYPALKKKGYGAIEYSDDSGRTIAVFDKNLLQTKSQLTDFYNKATGQPSPTLPETPTLKDKTGNVPNIEESRGVGVLNKISEPTEPPFKEGAKLGAFNPQYQRIFKPEETTKIQEIAEKMGKRDKTLEEIDNLRLHIDDVEQILENTNASKLVKYVSRTTGRLPEVTGKDTIQSLSGSGKMIKNSEFGKRGDDIVTELGFESPEEAQQALETYQDVKNRLSSFKKRLLKAKAEKKLIRAGEKLMTLTMSERRAQFRILKDRYDLTDKDVRDIRQDRDLSMMSPLEFKNFLSRAEQRAIEMEKIREARIQVEGTIKEKELKKVDNLQRALGLPEIKDMNEAQLKEFDELLSTYQHGDEFLGQRKLETIDRTPLKGVKTYREAREKFAQTLSQRFGRTVSPEELTNIVGTMDRMAWDTVLAEKHPFYRLMVEDVNATLLEAEGNILQIQEEVEEMMRRVNKGAKNKLVPRNQAIIEYLESEDKASIAPRLTPDEYKMAEYMRSYYNNGLNYLYQQKALHKSRFEDIYYTHMRRSFLEAIIDTPFSQGKVKTAMKELLDKTKLEKTIIDILNQKTGQILPMDKYFKYVNAREGNMVPSKNAGKVFMEYVKTLETKKALDKMVPEIMTYVDVLTPRKETRAGLKVDDKLKTFVTEYINNKKGRRATLLFEQGSKQDYILKAIGTFLSIRDLGINLAVQIGSNAGAQGGVYALLGPVKYAKALWRYKATLIPRKYQPETVARAQRILDQAKNYTGRNPWSELVDISKDVGDRVHSTLFVLFRDAVVRSNQIHLLGSLTKEEWQAGKISPQRLAQLRISAGRWLPVERAESIYGSTTVGKAGTKYKTWAIVMARTAMKNIREIALMTKNMEGKKLYESREFRETVNAGVFSALIALLAWGIASSLEPKDKKNPSFVDKVKAKLIQDGLSFIQALSPQTLLAAPRVTTFLYDLGTGLTELVKIERYQKSGKGYEKGDLKGAEKLKNTLKPNIISTLLDAFDSENGGMNLKNSPRLSGIRLVPKENNVTKLSKKKNLSGIKLVPKNKLQLTQ